MAPVAWFTEEADKFYTKEDAWETPVDAAFAQNQQVAQTANRGDRSMRPYYLLMRLPGEEASRRSP